MRFGAGARQASTVVGIRTGGSVGQDVTIVAISPTVSSSGAGASATPLR
jgi:hypothetical protein